MKSQKNLNPLLLKKIFALTIILALALLVVGCTSSSSFLPQQNEQEPLTIGVIAGLTGSAARHGTNSNNGIMLAIEEINQRGGVNGQIIQTITEDEKCDVTTGVQAARKLIDINQRSIIIGPTCSSTAMAIAPIAQQNKVIMITPVASVEDLRNAGDFIFRNRVSGLEYSYKIADFSVDTLRARTAAILYINQDNGISYRDSFEKRFVERGGIIVQKEAYENKATDFRTQLTKIKTNNPDVLYIAGQGHELAVKQAKDVGIKSKIIGPFTIETPELLTLAKEAAEGIYYSYSQFDPQQGTPHMRNFNERYKERFEIDAEGLAANSYDATMLIAKSLEVCGIKETSCVRDFLSQVKNYQGVSGSITFDPDGEILQPLTIKQVMNGTFVKVKE